MGLPIPRNCGGYYRALHGPRDMTRVEAPLPPRGTARLTETWHLL